LILQIAPFLLGELHYFRRRKPQNLKIE